MIMRLSRLIIALVMLLVLTDAAIAATLYGKIYDIKLKELNDVIVEVDSEPHQRHVSKDGSYSFELNPGEYNLTATYHPDDFTTYSVAEQIYINEEGDYVYDLFLFQGFDRDAEDLLAEEDIFDVEEKFIDDNGKISGLTVAIMAVVAIIVLLFVYYLFGRIKDRHEREEIEEAEKVEKEARALLRKEMEEAGVSSRGKETKPVKGQKHEELDDADLLKVIEIIKKDGGRTTQKELRRQIPLSEAKISLMISELEHKKLVQKVKKGRGNIIILKKK
ncbi:hypothetical protein JW898_06100 [Candidatus Woesearchaeota archaeon]|nr:hypothetical protein [Candidatus Woesearchaeota archaeon]